MRTQSKQELYDVEIQNTLGDKRHVTVKAASEETAAKRATKHNPGWTVTNVAKA